MKKLIVFAAVVLAAGCATSSDVQKLQNQVNELQERLAEVKRTAAGKEEVQGVNQRIADQTQQLLKSNATLVAKVDQIEDKMNNTQGAVEQTNHRLDLLAQQLTQAQRDIDDLKAAAARAAAAAAPPPTTTTAPAMPGSVPAPQPSMAEVSVAPPAGASEDPMELYQAAYRDYQKANYDLALSGFKNFLVKYPNSELAGNAEYWIGESLYSQKKYSDAIEQFNRVVNKYPKSDKAPGALLKKGYAYLALNDRPRAIVQFQYVVHEYPNSRESALAKDRLKQLGIDSK